MNIDKQIIETSKPNSFSGRYGGVGTDFKIYFDGLKDLKHGIDVVIQGSKYLEMKLKEGGQNEF